MGLKRIGDKKPARSGMVHLLLPATETEAKQLNQMAIAAVRVFVRDRKEIPIDSIYILEKRAPRPRLNILSEIFSETPVVELNPADLAVPILGRYEYTAYVFAPLALLRKGGELGVRFKGASIELPLLKLPIPEISSEKPGDKGPPPDPTRSPDLDFALALMESKYCLFRDGIKPTVSPKIKGPAGPVQ